jgi:alpha-glucosidase
MAETGSPIDIVMQYYGNEQQQGAHMPFNFLLLLNINNNSTAEDYKILADLWMSKMPVGRTANWVVSIIKPLCFLN